MKTTTNRSTKLLEAEGYKVALVEHWNHYTQRRHDLFGFADLLAIRENEILFVQSTSASNVSSRINKIEGHENTPHVRKAGIRIEVHGWKKTVKGWVCRREDLS